MSKKYTVELTKEQLEQLGIKVEPEFKIGDWITNMTHNIQVTEDHRWTGIHDSYKLWKPTRDEWCVFYTKYNKKTYMIKRYVKTMENRHYSETGNSDSIAPLEFIQTLKDK